MAAYSTSVPIAAFRGLNQSGDGYNLSMQYARELENVNVEGGSFRPMREGIQSAPELESPIRTLAFLHRRFVSEPDTLLIAFCLVLSGSTGYIRMYSKTLDEDDEWNLVKSIDAGSTGDPYAASFDWVTYEVGTYHLYDAERQYTYGERCSLKDPQTDEITSYKCTTSTPAGGEAWNADHWTLITDDAPVDILLFSNAKLGMFCMFGDDLSVVPVQTPKLFGVITRYNERVWGSGIEGDPDMLVYSAPYDPFDWEQNNDIPEDGAGDILQPTWDGDKFLALRQYGSSLLAIKRNSIWRIYGVSPGEFQMSMEYGGGTVSENTVCVYNDRAYMLGEHGLMQYNGTGVYPFLQDMVQDLMRDRVVRKLDVGYYPDYNPLLVYFENARCTYEGEHYRCVFPTETYPTEIHSVTGVWDFGNGESAQIPSVNLETLAATVGDDLRTVYVLEYHNDNWTFEGEVVDKADFGVTVSPRTPTVEGGKITLTTQLSYDFDIRCWVEVEAFNHPVEHTCAGMWNGVYCLALPLDRSERCNAILQYDPKNQAFSLRTGVSVTSFLQINERLFYTSADYPGRVYELDDNHGTVKRTEWISGYQDLGAKNSIKSAFVAYLMVESEAPVELRLGIRTEKKLKQKIVVTKPGKMLRVQLNNHGRIFRFEIRSYSAVPYTIAGGVRLEVELDPD